MFNSNEIHYPGRVSLLTLDFLAYMMLGLICGEGSKNAEPALVRVRMCALGLRPKLNYVELKGNLHQI